MREGNNKSVSENKNTLIEVYKNYLKDFDGIASNSKKSYVTYVKNAIRHFEKHYHNEINFYETVKHEFDNTCTLVNDYLNKIKNKEIEDVSSKTASNYFSAFALFQDILSEKCNNTKKTLNSYLKNVDNILYTKRNLDNVFLQRLRTQDRNYAEAKIKFPTRILNKQLNGWFNNMLKDSLEELILYDERGLEYKYKDLQKIEFSIKEGYVQAHIKGKKIKLYSPNSEYTKYTPFNPKKLLPEITLDHKKSLYEIICGNINQYPKLKDLSDKITNMDITTPNGKTHKELKLVDESIFRDEEFVRELKNEIKMIFKEIDLVAMSSSANKAKGKKQTK